MEVVQSFYVQRHRIKDGMKCFVKILFLELQVVQFR